MNIGCSPTDEYSSMDRPMVYSCADRWLVIKWILLRCTLFERRSYSPDNAGRFGQFTTTNRRSLAWLWRFRSSEASETYTDCSSIVQRIFTKDYSLRTVGEIFRWRSKRDIQKQCGYKASQRFFLGALIKSSLIAQWLSIEMKPRRTVWFQWDFSRLLLASKSLTRHELACLKRFMTRTNGDLPTWCPMTSRPLERWKSF